MRPIFTDYSSSFSHVLLGVIGGFFPYLSYLYVGYQVYEYYQKEDYIVTDLAEYALGYAITYFLFKL